ncbi:maleylpyruvate isomerase family mycothiol-dependent enzyme [Actinophytocola sp.]|uniref:maleylpyruvate isomerase family mycothiol-dependent enzyme n=1 Tax=Actinophytocola sp. TaxID=1872138 RepID=UPI002D7FC23A|nr:maleylpyruvate isomerase family mycothiol-dependent enzyme [Actinophytocola sp.]HET9139427.1 maleylpyruvate isomerase family mycothiol-dependent enzyme [Actinophytocola sp.]
MDYVAHLHREAAAFEAAARRAGELDRAPIVPSCPGWSVADLVLHLGGVHRLIAAVVRDRITSPPNLSGVSLPRQEGWPDPNDAPNLVPLPASLVDWFAAGAEALVTTLRETAPGEQVWTWSAEQNVGFWQRMQAIEAAVHRWDAENAVGTPAPVDPELAADAVAQTFQVMAPARRAWRGAPPGSGERLAFRQTDGADRWVVHFDGTHVRLDDGAAPVELAGSASDLMLFLWQRTGTDRLTVTGDAALADRYFTLVPPM